MRITRVYTGKGDLGMTGLGDGTKVPKDHPRVVAYGSVDKANSAIGCVRCEIDDDELGAVLADVQHRLFDVGGVLCMPGMDTPEFIEMLQERTGRMEALMDRWFELQGGLENFILPGGCRAAASLHVGRCAVREAEQLVVTLHRDEPVHAAVLTYLNRLSDMLFVMAREVNRRSGVEDVTWKPATDRG